MATPAFYMGNYRKVGQSGAFKRYALPAHHLITHGVVMIEEALRNSVPVLVIDVKGDLPNLLLALPNFSPGALLPWIEGCMPPGDDRTPEEVAVAAALERQQGLEAWGITESDLQSYQQKTEFRVITPGTSSGELLHLLSSLERHSERWANDPEAARDSLSAAVSLSALGSPKARRVPGLWHLWFGPVFLGRLQELGRKKYQLDRSRPVRWKPERAKP